MFFMVRGRFEENNKVEVEGHTPSRKRNIRKRMNALIVARKDIERKIDLVKGKGKHSSNANVAITGEEDYDIVLIGS